MPPALVRRGVLARTAAVIAFASVVPADASAVGAVAAFAVKEASPQPGDTSVFEIGVMPNDGTTWAPGSVSVTVRLTAPGAPASVTSDPVSTTAAVEPGTTAALFVSIPVARDATGAYTAQAVVRHDGAVVGTSDPVGIVVGAAHAEPVPQASVRPVSAQLGTNDILAKSGSQAISLSATGTGGGGRSFTTTGSLTSVTGASQPLVTFGSSATSVRVGTFSPSFDNLVLAGPNGTGFTVQQLLGTNRSVQFVMLSGGHATPNPFSIDGLRFATPVAAGLLGVTTAYAQTDGPAAEGTGTFLRTGNLLGFDYIVPADGHGLSYGGRYSLVNYVDGSSDARRVDHSIEALAGFNLLKTAFTLDAIRSGPSYPTVSAPGLTADREDELFTAARPIGSLSARFQLELTHTGLPGSRSGQIGNVANEGLTLAYALRDGDGLELDLSNAINHIASTTDVASLAQNAGFVYRAQRGPTSFEFDSSTATNQDDSHVTSHTITDAVSLGRTVAAGLGVSTRYAATNTLGSASQATTVSQQGGVNLTYALPSLTLSGSVNRSHALPASGEAAPANLDLLAGAKYSPKRAPFELEVSFTQSRGPSTTSNLRFNLTEKL